MHHARPRLDGLAGHGLGPHESLAMRSFWKTPSRLEKEMLQAAAVLATLCSVYTAGSLFLFISRGKLLVLNQARPHPQVGFPIQHVFDRFAGGNEGHDDSSESTWPVFADYIPSRSSILS